MRKYVVREMKNRKYGNMFGVTDYDIPMFGFKSACFIMGVTFLSLVMCVQLSQVLGIKSILPTAVISGIMSGFSVAISQFFIETKKGLCKNFWYVGSAISCVAFILIVVVN